MIEQLFEMERDLSEAELRFTKTAREVFPKDRELAEDVARLVQAIRQTKSRVVRAARLEVLDN